MRLIRHLPLSLVFTGLAIVYVAAAAALTMLLTPLLPQRWMAAAGAVALLAPLLAYHVRRAFAPMNALFRALAGSVASYRDGDFGFGLAWRGRGALAAWHQRR